MVLTLAEKYAPDCTLRNLNLVLLPSFRAGSPCHCYRYRLAYGQSVLAYLSDQTSSAISFTSLSFAHCSSSVSLLPISQDANPHCGLKYKRSSGTYFAASWILAITFSLSSSSGVLVVISPSTTFLSPDTFASGANPPDLLSSYSR